MVKPRSLASRKRQKSRTESRPAKRPKTGAERTAEYRFRFQNGLSVGPEEVETGVIVCANEAATGAPAVCRVSQPRRNALHQEVTYNQGYHESWQRATEHF